MTRKLYAFLVGINEYDGGVRSLHGCVNDVKRLQQFLAARAHAEDFQLHTHVLTSGDRDNPGEIKPTRAAVIDGFRTFLSQAGPEDVALFYYSGHGSQEQAPPEFIHLEPDRLNETLVCYDSRTEKQWDLADKELAVLIAELARRKPHILILLDACHSGSGTRAVDGGVRLAPTDKRARPLQSFEGYAQIVGSQPVLPGQTSSGDWLQIPEGNHVVISACRAEEVANERFLGDDIHGVLSYYLLDSLQRAAAGITYRDLFARISTLVRNQIAEQHPVIEASVVKQLSEPFLGGAIRPQPAYFSLTYTKEIGWSIDGGEVHGIDVPSDGETTTLAVFSADTDLAGVKTLDEAIGFAHVTMVEPGRSQVTLTLTSGEEPQRKDAFRAMVVSQPLPPMRAQFLGDEVGLNAVREALKVAGDTGGPSLIVREVSQEDIRTLTERMGVEVDKALLAPLTLIARDGRYLIRRSDDAFPLMVPVESGYTPGAARIAVKRLEHVARWLQVASLDHKTSSLPANAVGIEVYAVQTDGSLGERLDVMGDEVRLSYHVAQGKWRQPYFKLKLVNHTDRRLYCALLDLTDSFAIKSAGLLKGGGEWLEPHGQEGSEIWTYQGKPIPAGIRKALLDQGVVTGRDILKLIVSTTEIPAVQLERDALDVSTRSGDGVEIPEDMPQTSLSRLFTRVQTRGVGDEAPPDETVMDWMTSQVTLVTVHPRSDVPIPPPGGRADLSDLVSIAGHPGLKAQARLTSHSEGTRAVGNLALPAPFRLYPELAVPFQFSAARGGEPGLSVLELRLEDDSYKQVTPENPLQIEVRLPLQEGEYVLPLAYDPADKLFLPLGRSQRHANKTTLYIDRLPPPLDGARDIAGSIKLFFQKIVAEKLGLGDGHTNRLALATLTADGKVHYDPSPIAISAAVSTAQRILLYIHGLVGDTRGMVTSAHSLPAPTATVPPMLAENYDLILAFDYENINTPIEQTALDLKSQLAEVGLEANHTKTLHIIAHSLGCMVTRWFVEHQGGNKIVHKAILVGPPNQGTPWAKIEDLAIMGLGAAINGLATLIWPPAAIPTLVGIISSTVAGVEKIDVTLDQIKPNSTFLKTMNASQDPEIPYVVIAGNTAKIGETPAATPPVDQNLWERLLTRLTSLETRNRLLGMAFFGDPNDIAISVKSMRTLPSFSQLEAPIEIACDHLSYFNSEVGLKALAKATGVISEP